MTSLRPALDWKLAVVRTYCQSVLPVRAGKVSTLIIRHILAESLKKERTVSRLQYSSVDGFESQCEAKSACELHLEDSEFLRDNNEDTQCRSSTSTII